MTLSLKVTLSPLAKKVSVLLQLASGPPICQLLTATDPPTVIPAGIPRPPAATVRVPV